MLLILSLSDRLTIPTPEGTGEELIRDCLSISLIVVGKCRIFSSTQLPESKKEISFSRKESCSFSHRALSVDARKR